VKTPGPIKYVASKVLAERAAWSWVEKNKPTFDLVTVLPPWVWGVSILDPFPPAFYIKTYLDTKLGIRY
jgi:nucleoside-diphosphate-sugar epimerase